MVWTGILGLLVLAVTGGAMRASGGQVAKALPECPAGAPIVIDPGHGGIDGGTNVPGLLEKDVVLAVALKTRDLLKRQGVPVVLTRDADEDLGGVNDVGRLRRDLNYRIRVANHCRAGFMLSLHVNHTANTSQQGMIIFYQPSRTGRDAAYLFDDVLRRWPLHERRERPIPRPDFAVLKTQSPAILVEMGFVSNPSDRQRLTDPVYRDNMAKALASACGAIYHQWLK
jgi:N-acetylmuramoyl-L-alanine amidase